MEFTGERYIPNYPDKQIEIEHLQRYYSIVDLVKDKVVVDAACGEGYGAYLLAKSAEKVIGIDISNEAILNAQMKYTDKTNISFIQGSVDALTMLDDSSVDIFVSFETIEHINEQQQHDFLLEVTRVLKDDGIFLVSTPDKYWYSELPKYNNPFHVKEFYEDEFKAFLGKFFLHFQYIYQKFEVLSVLANNSSNQVTHLPLKENISLNQGKYIIAICSKIEVEDINISSIISIEGITYNNLMTRIITLQEEVEERNIHMRNLDQQINDWDYKNQLQITELKFKSEEIEKKKEEIEKQKEEIEKQKEVKQKQYETINEQKQLIEQRTKELTDKKVDLDHILNSDMWKLFSKYYKLRDVLLPQNSKRKLFAKLLKKTVTEPRFMLKKLNMQNMRKFRYYLNTERSSMLEDRIDNYLERFNSDERTPHEIILVDNNEPHEKLIFPKFDIPTVSIIIPVYNQWLYTYSCLKSILVHTLNISYEIIIADDVSTDETLKINEYAENITVIRDDINRGFLLNCKNAASHAKGEYLFFLNNDTNVQANYLDSLVELIESDKNIGMVGSKLVYPDGRLQESGGIIWNDASGWNYGRLDDPSLPQYNYVKEVDFISGAAIMIRTSLWIEIGGFDERYVPAYYEDADLAFEVRRHGYKVLLQPKSVVVHFEGVSHGTNTNTGIKTYQLVNQAKFIGKWGKVLKEEHFENAHNVFQARDRTAKQKTIVIVDHYVPHYDKDAGGRCTYQYIRLFRSLGFHVIFIGDNYYKHEPYTTELEQMGIEVLYGEWFSQHIDQWIKQNGQYFDYVYLNRPHISIKYIDTFKKHSKAKIIYFGLDLHYIREARNYEFDKNPELLKSSEKWKVLEFELCEKADVIHVVGSFEQEILFKEFPNKLVRNIPLYMFEEAELLDQIQTFESRENLLFVGGFNHKPNYDAIKWFVDEIYPLVLKSKPNIKLYIVGSNPPEDIKKLNSENIIITGFVSDEVLNKYYSECRLVIVPLRFGAGVKGKVVEAMFNQVPMITTSIGAEGLTAIEEVACISDDFKSFASKVIELYDDHLLWNQMSERSREYIKLHFSTKAATEQVLLDFYPIGK